MATRWNTFTTRDREAAKDRLSWLNLEIMQAKLKKNCQRLRGLVAERRQVEEGLMRNDRRATTIIA